MLPKDGDDFFYIFLAQEALVLDLFKMLAGIDKEDIDIQIQGNILRVIYDKPKTELDSKFYHRGIAKRAFNLGWKIDSKFQLSKAEASFENGLLRIGIPFSKGSELKTLKIK